jgi:hypothetical protein
MAAGILTGVGAGDFPVRTGPARLCGAKFAGGASALSVTQSDQSAKTNTETKITAVRTMRRTAVGAALVLAAALILGARGCGSSTAVGTTAARPGPLTVAQARQVYGTFVTTDDVARAAGDESLELALVSEAQLPLTVSAYEQADYTGTPAPRYRFGPPALYVPQMKSFPFWFVVVAPRTPARGGPTRTAIMVFSRPTAADSWKLSLSTLLQPGAALPRIALDPNGHASSLATFDHGLLVSPNSVGALQAALADDGPGAQAASVVAAGPATTGVYDQIVSTKRQLTRLGLRYDSTLQGSAFPLYALGTADGSALVLYSLVRSTTILRPSKGGPQIQIPRGFAPILHAAGRMVIQTELDTGATYQYAAEVPASQHAGKRAAQMRVVASDGGPTSAGGA